MIPITPSCCSPQADFIAKKRDMFLIQMSLDTKRQEIQKLEEKVHTHTHTYTNAYIHTHAKIHT